MPAARPARRNVPSDTCSAHASSTTPNDFAATEAMLAALRTELMSGASAISPVFPDGGAMAGMEVSPAGPCAAELGLEDGDVLLRMNGVDFSSPDAWLQMLVTARQASYAAVRIERGGRLIELRYQLP